MTVARTLLRPPICADVWGNGRVARALFPRLQGVRVPLRRIHDSQGLRFEDVRADGEAVLVDCTAPRYEGAGAAGWTGVLRDALRAGTSVVTCNKAPLVRDWGGIHAAAREGGARLLASATVGGGTPILPTLARLARSQEVTRVEACLSGTLAFVLDRVAAGASMVSAVGAAQVAGYAEPDPRLDLDGTDAFAKAAILHNSLWPEQPTVGLDARRPLQVHPGPVRAIARAGGTPRLVAAIEPGRIRLVLSDAAWAADDGPGAAVARVETALGTYRIGGPGAGPDVTAANILADLLELAAPRTG